MINNIRNKLNSKNKIKNKKNKNLFKINYNLDPLSHKKSDPAFVWLDLNKIKLLITTVMATYLQREETAF